MTTIASTLPIALWAAARAGSARRACSRTGLASAIPIALSGWMVWAPPASLSPTALIVWMTVAVFAFNLGTALAVAGRLEEAIRQFTRAAELDPGNAGIRNNLGIALARAGRLEESVAQLERAATLQPGNQETARNLNRARDLLSATPAPKHSVAGAPHAGLLPRG